MKDDDFSSQNAPDADHTIEIFNSLTNEEPTPEAAFDRFFDWYQDVWLMNDDLASTMKTMPRPFRELAVTHQAFGYMSSEAPSGYYIRFDPLFDDEVKLGLERLGISDSYFALADGRKLFEMSDDNDLTIEQNSEIYDKLPTLEQIERRVGRWLIENVLAD